MRASDRTPRRRLPWPGALVTILLVTSASGSVDLARASVGSGERAVFVPITPCRLVDTRPAPDNVGPRSTPIGPAETVVQPVSGTNGNCTIPNDATAVAMNVTAVDPSASSFFTVWPSDVDRPLTANLNWVAGAAPTPNKADVKLAVDGSIAVYNLAGTVHLVIDVFGYYADHHHDDRYQPKGNYLQVGPVTMYHGLADWRPNGNFVSNTTIRQFDVSTTVENGTAFPTYIQTVLTGPASIGGTSYRIQSVQWCIAGRVGVPYVTSASLDVATSGVADDQTNRSATGCYTLTADPSVQPGGGGALLGLSVAFTANYASEQMRLGQVTSTWVPIG